MKPDHTRVSPNRHEGVIREPHIQYTHVDERRKRRLTLDLYRPAKTEGVRPAIVMFYGGGWMNGRPGQLTALAQALVERGYVCVVPQYRLSGEKPFPAAVHDCKAAIRWTRKNAKRYSIDPRRIATMGGSAGGHLAGFMAASNGVKQFEGEGDHHGVSSDVQAAVVMCGAMNFLESFIVDRLEKAAGTLRSDAVIDFMGGALPRQKTGIYREASPVTHVSKRTPPMLFIDGELDKPGLRYASLGSAACVTSFNAWKAPLIHPVGDCLFAVTVGNGSGAKCSDEIGRLGAVLALGGDLAAEGYESRFGPNG